eukprot:1150325-Pelagomonas_calceolata.AAC.1
MHTVDPPLSSNSYQKVASLQGSVESRRGVPPARKSKESQHLTHVYLNPTPIGPICIPFDVLNHQVSEDISLKRIDTCRPKVALLVAVTLQLKTFGVHFPLKFV